MPVQNKNALSRRNWLMSIRRASPGRPRRSAPEKEYADDLERDDVDTKHGVRDFRRPHRALEVDLVAVPRLHEQAAENRREKERGGGRGPAQVVAECLARCIGARVSISRRGTARSPRRCRRAPAPRRRTPGRAGGTARRRRRARSRGTAPRARRSWCSRHPAPRSPSRPR